MFLPIRRTAPYLLAIVALIALAIVASGCGPRALAAVGQSSSAQPASDRSITVLGRAVASGKPDLAQASVGVETFAATVGEAVEQNTAKMTAVMARLRAIGIPDKDIQTANFSINFERRGPEDTDGVYRVSNMVQVKIHELDEVSSILDAAVQAGANQVWGVNFTIEDQEALEVEARGKAMEDARQRGEALARLANVQLGQVLYVAEGGTTSPILARKGMGGGGMPAAELAPISPGEVQIVYQVEVTYAIQ